MNLVLAAPGTCGACSAQLAPGQRYCVACGERRGELPVFFRPPERVPRASVPIAAVLGGRRSFGTVGAIVLASGILIGAAVGPALTPASFASSARQVVLVAGGPAAAAATPAAATPAGGGASSSSSLSAPSGNVAAAAQQVAAASAPAPAPALSVTPAAVTPTAPTPAPTPAPPPAAPVEQPSVAGTVVHVAHDGRGYAVATKEGQLIALHATKAPALGDRLKATVNALQNGTFEELKPNSKGHADSAKFHGTVTFSDTDNRVYSVSARGVSLLVHLPPVPPPADPAAPPPAPPPPAPPAAGTLTTVDVAFRPADATAGTPAHLEEVKRVDGDQASGEIDLEAIVRDPAPAPADPAQLTVSADDAGESPATLSLKVPPGVDVSKLKPGTVILATVKREADGSLTLVSASDDSSAKKANAR